MGACADDLGVVHHGGCVHLDELVIRYRGLVGVSLIRGSLIRRVSYFEFCYIARS